MSTILTLFNYCTFLGYWNVLQKNHYLMRKLKFLTPVMMAILLASCGGKSGDDGDHVQVLIPETTEVSGDLEDCFTVVEKEYKVTGDFTKILTVEIERTNEALPFDTDDAGEIVSFSTIMSSLNTQVGFGIEFLDEDDNVVGKVNATGSGFSGSYSPDEAVELVKLKPGKKGTIRFSVGSDEEKATKFRITSAYESNGGSNVTYDTTSSDSSDDDDSYMSWGSDSDDGNDFSSNNGTDWDEVLDSYEEYVDDYVKLVKRISNGDTSAMADVASFSQKAQSLSSKLSNGHGSMSSSQWSRYLQITQKMTNAAQNMYK